MTVRQGDGVRIPRRQHDDDQPSAASTRARDDGPRHGQRPDADGLRWPEVSVDIAVGQMRQIEFVADEEGDWAFLTRATTR